MMKEKVRHEKKREKKKGIKDSPCSHKWSLQSLNKEREVFQRA